MGSNRRHIPLEIVEEIVLNLPVKSVIRFSTVSKSWNSIVSGLGFIKRYRGREMMGLLRRTSDHLSPSSLSSFSSLSSLTTEDATNLIYQLPGDRRRCLIASCDELWCIEIGNALFLYNPSMKTCRKLPDPHELPYPREYGFYGFVFGLGYDAAGDDYKLLKCPRGLGPETESELYSLRSDSWRKISPSLPYEICSIIGKQFVFFNGMLHCICHSRSYNMREGLLCFDLSTEKYGEMAPVPERYQSKLHSLNSGMMVLRGKLCVFFNNFKHFLIVPDFYLLEIDEEYSWTIKFHIDCRYQTIPNTPENLKHVVNRLIPLYLYDNGDILMNFFRRNSSKILMYKKKENIFIDGSCSNILDGVVYVQTLVSL